MSRVRHIFTYGTLMSVAEGSMGAAERALMRAQARLLGTASLRGVLLDAGACPGAVLGGVPGDRVHGELWRLPAGADRLLAALDRYEGCTADCPQPHAYARAKVRVGAPDGRRITAWIYVWIKPAAGLPAIADGRWRGAVRTYDQPSAIDARSTAALQPRGLVAT